MSDGESDTARWENEARTIAQYRVILTEYKERAEKAEAEAAYLRGQVLLISGAAEPGEWANNWGRNVLAEHDKMRRTNGVNLMSIVEHLKSVRDTLEEGLERAAINGAMHAISGLAAREALGRGEYNA